MRRIPKDWDIPDDIREDAEECFDDPVEFLDAPNVYLGAKTPLDVIGTEQEKHLRDVLSRVKHGAVS